MSQTFRLAQPGSPLIPNNNNRIILDAAMEHYKSGKTEDPAVSLAFAVSVVMTAHRVILTLEPQHLAQFGLDVSCLDHLHLGYKLPLEAIQIGAWLRDVSSEDRLTEFEKIVTPTRDYLTVLVQELLNENANCLANLFDIDPSGALIFEHMRRYNTIHHEVFVNGMEIAAQMYWNLAPEFAKDLGDDSWLTTDYDPTITGGPLT